MTKTKTSEAGPLRRRRDWERRLEAEIVKASRRPFRFASHDCLRFPMRCIAAMTGTSPGRAFAGANTAKKVAGVINNAGGLIDLVTAVMNSDGFPPVLPLKARRGDVVIVQTPAGLSGGVVGLDGRTVFVATRPKGLVGVPLALETVKAAWMVG